MVQRKKGGILGILLFNGRIVRGINFSDLYGSGCTFILVGTGFVKLCQIPFARKILFIFYFCETFIFYFILEGMLLKYNFIPPIFISGDKIL